MPHNQNSSLWERYFATRSVALRNRLAEDNRKLAYRVAHRWSKQCAEPVEDLEQIACIGLLKAIERFDRSRNAAFSSFAVPWISGEIQHFLRDHWGPIKIPRKAFEDVSAAKRIQKKMAAAGRTIDLASCAAAAGISKDRWDWIAQAVQRRQLATLDEVQDVAVLEPEISAERLQLYKLVLKAIAKLPANQRRCVIARHFSGRGIDAIARQEQQPLKTISGWLEQAESRLKQEIEAYGLGDQD